MDTYSKACSHHLKTKFTSHGLLQEVENKRLPRHPLQSMLFSIYESRIINSGVYKLIAHILVTLKIVEKIC